MELRCADARSDADSIAALIAAATTDGDPAPLSEEAEHEVGSGVVGQVAIEGDRVVGYIHRRAHGPVTILEPVVAPDAPEAIAAAVVAAAVEKAGEGPLHLWTASDVLGAEAGARGLRPDRRVECLERSLPFHGAAAVPAGVRTAGFRTGTDDRALLLVHREAFAGHRDLGDWDRRALGWRFGLQWFDPADLVLAWERGRPVAVVWTKIARPEVGEVYLIACRPVAQGRGLGRAMTALGLRHLGDRGVSTGRVFTDADNAAATRLYRELGFERISVRTRWVREVPAS